jgi:trypsin-like peptidase
MAALDYWVDLSHGEVRLGAGFLLTRYYVLTAAHCLGDRVGEGAVVTISRRSGDTAKGIVLEINKARDVALVQVQGRLPWDMTLAVTDRCEDGDDWFSPYRPTLKTSELKGRVLKSATDFECVGGAVIEALELQVWQLLAKFSGYSGSPVERRVDRSEPTDERALVGMLIEQQPHGTRPKEATNVLFAITIQHATDAFDAFDPPRLHSRLDNKLVPERTPSPDGSTTADEVSKNFATVPAVIGEIRELSARGYISPADALDCIRHAVNLATQRSIERGDNGDATR